MERERLRPAARTALTASSGFRRRAGRGPQRVPRGTPIESLLVRPRFAADANVGRLARWLRALGYDCVYVPHVDDTQLVRLALAESRVLLTRDQDLTRRRVITAGQLGCVLIRHDSVQAQLRQVVTELGLDREQALSRCLECNVELRPRPRSAVANRLPPRVLSSRSGFSECPRCGRVYWAGSHFSRMSGVLASLV